MPEWLLARLKRVNPWVVLVGWVLFAWAWCYALGVIMARLPNDQYRWLLFLLTVLWSLTVRIGDKRRTEYHTRMTQGPLTLAGPIHPWRTTDGALALPLIQDDLTDDEPSFLDSPVRVRLATGIWNPALVRPLLDDNEEDF